MLAGQIVKSAAKRILPERVVRGLKALRALIGDDYPQVPFDNTYPWLNYCFSQVIKDPLCAAKPPYVWGVAQGAALARVLGESRISVIEFGVAGGRGLIARIAEAVSKLTEISMDVFGSILVRGCLLRLTYATSRICGLMVNWVWTRQDCCHSSRGRSYISDPSRTRYKVL